MSFFRMNSCVVTFVLCALCQAGRAEPPRSTLPVIPPGTEVEKLTDDQIMKLALDWRFWTPEGGLSESARRSDRAEADRFTAELRRRGDHLWKVYGDVGGDRLAELLHSMSDSAFCILIFGMPEPRIGLAETREPSLEQASIIHEAIGRGGLAFDIVAALQPIGDAGEMRSLTDQKLEQAFAANSRSGVNRDKVLQEMIRRGDGKWEPLLSHQWAREKEDAFSCFSQYHVPRQDIELLTALRRLQKKPDPVQIDVEGSGVPEVETPWLPRLDVALVNRDSGGETIQIETGDGNRFRWQVEVTDAAGNPMPARSMIHEESEEPAGVRSLKPGEKWESRLAMSDYVAGLPPGKFFVRVFRHDWAFIAGASRVGDYICCASRPFTIIVKSRVLRNGQESRKQAADLISKLQDGSPLKIVAGTYGPWAHEFVPPDSAEGRLLQMGFDAVPALVEAVTEEHISQRRRAAFLGLLFSITGENDPREEFGVMVDYKYVTGGWEIAGPDGKFKVGSFGGSGSSNTVAEPEVQLQKKFAGRWKPWRDYIKVEN